MPQDEKTSARERRLIRARAEKMQVALARVLTDVDALAPTDRLIVLNDALTDALREHRRHVRARTAATAAAAPSNARACQT
jgi:hypothetical protein